MFSLPLQNCQYKILYMNYDEFRDESELWMKSSNPSWSMSGVMCETAQHGFLFAQRVY